MAFDTLMRRRQGLGLLAAALPFGAAWAQPAWPAGRPVSLVIPYGAGGGSDVVAQVFIRGIAEDTGGTFVMDHKPGAATTLAARYVARARPDGYTLLLGSVSTFTTAPLTLRNPGYDPLADFAHVTMVAETLVAVVANPRWASMAALLEGARQRPGALSYASWGIGSTSHLFLVDLMARTGTDFVHVPYNSTPPALTDVIAGRVDLMLSPLATARAHIEAGRVTGLAMVRGDRVAVVPDVPTTDEVGLVGLRSSGWWGLHAPAGTPQPILDRVARSAATAFADPANRALLDGVGMAAVEPGPAALRARIEAELPKHQMLLARAGVVPE